jgi:GntR family transcriptional regulator, transcriptional repressor for pyruvate dehydrogenase complex
MTVETPNTGLNARRVRSAPEQIVASIRASILDGSLGPGDRLPSEQAMAELYGVSRPTVREALRTLRADHVLTSSRGRSGGYRVAELSLQALGSSVGEVISLSLGMKTLTYAQLFVIRFDLELRSAATAAEARTEEDLERLRAALPEDPATLSAEATVATDVNFHRTLAEATHNPLIVGFAGATATAFRRFSDDVGEIDPPQMLAHLDEVVAAVAAADAGESREAMRRHLRYFSRYFNLE